MAKKKVGVSIEENLHAEVKSLAPKRRMSVEKAYEQALQAWLDRSSVSGATGANSAIAQGYPDIPREMVPLVEWFVEFLQSNGTPEQEALKASLKVLTAERTAEVRRLKKPKKNA